MKKNNLLVKYDKDLRLRIAYPEAQKEITGDVVRFVRPAPGMNFVSFTFANEGQLDRAIGSTVEYFSPKNQPFTWKVYDHDHLPSLKDRLVSHGFSSNEEGDPVMVLDVKRVPAQSAEFPTADIRRITSRAGLKDIVHVLDRVYGGKNDWVYDRLGLHLAIPGYLSVYASYVDGKPASIAWTYFPRGHFATLFGGTTLPEYRKRGLYTSLLGMRLREIRERGYSFAVVETGPMSKPIVERHGFQQLTTVWDYEWQGT
jgi:GNAT superfamily N-acetyltransferase